MSTAGAARRIAPATAGFPVTGGRRTAWVVIAALIAILLGVGTTLLLSLPSVRQAQRSYAAATPYRCGNGQTPPTGISCWQGVEGTLVSLDQSHTWTGARRLVAAVSVGGVVRTIAVEHSGAGECTTPGAPVVLRFQGDLVTSIFTPAGVMPTAANPYVDPDLVLDGGLTLVAAAMLIPCGLYLAVLRRRQAGAPRTVGSMWASTGVRLGVAVFLVGQAADVVTSAIGQQRGLDEGNPLVDVFVRITGPAGFLLFRLPAVVLVLLGLSQIPRRVAMLTLLGLGGLFCLVGYHNAVLAAGTGGLPTCGPGVALP